MPVSYPFDLLKEIRAWSTDFSLHRRQEMSRTALGRTYVKDLGSPLWTATYQSPVMSPNELDRARAILDTMEDGLQTFFGLQTSRCFPISYPNATWPGNELGKEKAFGDFISNEFRINSVSVTMASAISLARLSEATYFDASGVMQIAPVNTLRIDHNPETGELIGALLEPTRSNVCTFSGDLSATTPQEGATKETTSIICPDGVNFWTKVVEGVVSGTYRIQRGIAGATLPVNSYSWFTVYLKAAERRRALVAHYSFAGWLRRVSLVIDLVDGEVVYYYSTDGDIHYRKEYMGDGVWKVSIRGQANDVVTTRSFGVGPRLDDAQNASAYVGDGVSGILTSCWQVEPINSASEKPSSYIPTETVAVTREADQMTINADGDNGWKVNFAGGGSQEYERENDFTLTSGSPQHVTNYKAKLESRSDTLPGVTLRTVAADNKTISLAGLPVGFQLKAGDMIQIGETDLHRVVEDAISGSTGITGDFEVRPHLWPGATAGDTVSVAHAHCIMAIVPGSISTQADARTGRGAVSFQSFEAR